eukprot:2310007-Pleurochrysis_carterae.AAC.2
MFNWASRALSASTMNCSLRCQTSHRRAFGSACCTVRPLELAFFISMRMPAHGKGAGLRRLVGPVLFSLGTPRIRDRSLVDASQLVEHWHPTYFEGLPLFLLLNRFLHCYGNTRSPDNSRSLWPFAYFCKSARAIKHELSRVNASHVSGCTQKARVPARYSFWQAKSPSLSV